VRSFKTNWEQNPFPDLITHSFSAVTMSRTLIGQNTMNIPEIFCVHGFLSLSVNINYSTTEGISLDVFSNTLLITYLLKDESWKDLIIQIFHISSQTVTCRVNPVIKCSLITSCLLEEWNLKPLWRFSKKKNSSNPTADKKNTCISIKKFGEMLGKKFELSV